MGQTQKQQKLKKKQNLSSKTDSPAELTFIEHVYELRKRLFWVVLIIVLGSAIGFQYKDFLITAVMAPLHGEKLIYLTPGGGFSFIFTLSLYFGVLLAIPFTVYHLYRFLQPILGATSRRFVPIFMILSTLLAAAGALFGYFVTIPAALNFLATFAGDTVIPSLTAESYLSFVVTYVLGLALIFQLPLLIFIFDHVHPFPPGTLSSTQRFVIIGATVLAAIITPTPDAVNMAIVAVPVIVVYQFGAFAVFIRRHKRRKAPVIETVASTPLHDALEQAFLEDSVAKQASKPALVSETVELVENPAAEPLTASLQQTVELEFEPEVTPQVARQMPVTPAPQPRRSVDGFMRPGQPATLTVPPRRQAQPIMPQRQPSRQTRSIDGFLPA